MRPPGTQIPKSKMRNVRTHIYYHNWKDSNGITFNNTRSIIGAKSNTGKLTLHLQGGDPWQGNRELEFRVMTNDKPEQPVANYVGSLSGLAANETQRHLRVTWTGSSLLLFNQDDLPLNT